MYNRVVGWCVRCVRCVRYMEYLTPSHVARRVSSTATLHVSFLEKLSKVAQRRCGERTIREARAPVCVTRSRAGGCVRARSEGRIFVPTLRSIGVHESALWSRAVSVPLPPAGRGGAGAGRRAVCACAGASAGAGAACPHQSPRGGEAVRVCDSASDRPAASALRRKRIFLDNSANNLFLS